MASFLFSTRKTNLSIVTFNSENMHFVITQEEYHEQKQSEITIENNFARLSADIH